MADAEHVAAVAETIYIHNRISNIAMMLKTWEKIACNGSLSLPVENLLYIYAVDKSLQCAGLSRYGPVLGQSDPQEFLPRSPSFW